ncbi:hypothetical protein EHI8A_018370 [Entamoeba histolytica HM-1:IMSS-B]|uniref:Uncharacterized protein n=6 Tax=Entamoeba histolytica TaxID=5759 RepID=C4M370_ENTH1|nr:hypothetical protein EHI_086150 [Entamoeba histolytica HM-1:IMSS]EMD46315.1 Hypothetical protein EHI5A_017880 [Entamoeba histolytica KU27]EMH76019.1 hypothetical protein EHI8A_018370 [Entamoeba histolytica HM-1:IMSS-B]EMS15263.1 hypothetical protein KM1_018230 [Entamoeba histolytica HM-3:IMSS]ENY61256.1 hypothetical protein EHI7A_007510 [Entamoeba histolytica HM-1:IMSS-A]GAT95750.1 hypothetical protein CL6EHI_086150 [Entamoeba histolytica]|eukprot:XP_653093.2 hypothetical protein EHI_086150 [Entamoeba histolytica HM-1:IMSS]
MEETQTPPIYFNVLNIPYKRVMLFKSKSIIVAEKEPPTRIDQMVLDIIDIIKGKIVNTIKSSTRPVSIGHSENILFILFDNGKIRVYRTNELDNNKKSTVLFPSFKEQVNIKTVGCWGEKGIVCISKENKVTFFNVLSSELSIKKNSLDPQPSSLQLEFTSELPVEVKSYGEIVIAYSQKEMILFKEIGIIKKFTTNECNVQFFRNVSIYNQSIIVSDQFNIGLINVETLQTSFIFNPIEEECYNLGFVNWNLVTKQLVFFVITVNMAALFSVDQTKQSGELKLIIEYGYLFPNIELIHITNDGFIIKSDGKFYICNSNPEKYNSPYFEIYQLNTETKELILKRKATSSIDLVSQQRSPKLLNHLLLNSTSLSTRDSQNSHYQSFTSHIQPSIPQTQPKTQQQNSTSISSKSHINDSFHFVEAQHKKESQRIKTKQHENFSQLLKTRVGVPLNILTQNQIRKQLNEKVSATDYTPKLPPKMNQTSSKIVDPFKPLVSKKINQEIPSTTSRPSTLSTFQCSQKSMSTQSLQKQLPTQPLQNSMSTQPLQNSMSTQPLQKQVTRQQLQNYFSSSVGVLRNLEYNYDTLERVVDIKDLRCFGLGIGPITWMKGEITTGCPRLFVCSACSEINEVTFSATMVPSKCFQKETMFPPPVFYEMKNGALLIFPQQQNSLFSLKQGYIESLIPSKNIKIFPHNEGFILDIPLEDETIIKFITLNEKSVIYYGKCCTEVPVKSSDIKSIKTYQKLIGCCTTDSLLIVYPSGVDIIHLPPKFVDFALTPFGCIIIQERGEVYVICSQPKLLYQLKFKNKDNEIDLSFCSCFYDDKLLFLGDKNGRVYYCFIEAYISMSYLTN